MNDYLSNLAARSLAFAASVQPRRFSLFEPLPTDDQPSHSIHGDITDDLQPAGETRVTPDSPPTLLVEESAPGLAIGRSARVSPQHSSPVPRSNEPSPVGSRTPDVQPQVIAENGLLQPSLGLPTRAMATRDNASAQGEGVKSSELLGPIARNAPPDPAGPWSRAVMAQVADEPQKMVRASAKDAATATESASAVVNESLGAAAKALPASALQPVDPPLHQPRLDQRFTRTSELQPSEHFVDRFAAEQTCSAARLSHTVARRPSSLLKPVTSRVDHATSTPNSSPAVHVTIGRIEVRAVAYNPSGSRCSGGKCRATSSGTQGTSNFCLFHTRNCAASPALTASATCNPDAFSCATREKMRSPPARSTRTRMPVNFCSKALPTFSASWRSAEVYQVSWPSFVAAAISAGVMVSAGGAAARRCVA